MMRALPPADKGFLPALSVRQPWADLILGGWKDVENRSRPTSLRGPLLIHAPKTIDADAVRRFDRLLGFARGDYVPVTGALLGVVRLVDCVTSSPSRFFSGPYGWVLAAPMRFAIPVPWPGQRGIFRVPDGAIDRYKD